MAKKVNGFTLEEALENVNNEMKITDSEIINKCIAATGFTKDEYYTKWKESLNILYN